MVCMILDPQVRGVGLTKSGVQLAIQHTIDLDLHLFPEKETTINRSSLVKINNCMGNKHALFAKACLFPMQLLIFIHGALIVTYMVR